MVGVLRIPEDHASPVRVITRRMVIALAVLFAATFVVYLDRGGYRDVRGDPPTFLDCLYFAAVSLSTTGYGDITPYTEAARLVNTVVFTPLRIAFLAVLVGTTLEVLSERSRLAWKIQRWRSRVRNHTIVIGYGTKGKTAVAAILGDEAAQGEVVVVDTDPTALENAATAGLVTVHGDATKSDVLRLAGAQHASSIMSTTLGVVVAMPSSRPAVSEETTTEFAPDCRNRCWFSASRIDATIFALGPISRAVKVTSTAVSSRLVATMIDAAFWAPAKRSTSDLVASPCTVTRPAVAACSRAIRSVSTTTISP